MIYSINNFSIENTYRENIRLKDLLIFSDKGHYRKGTICNTIKLMGKYNYIVRADETILRLRHAFKMVFFYTFLNKEKNHY